MFRDFLLGFIRIHVLHHAAQKPIYGVWMMEELQQHGYEISPGTLYPILHRMEQKGYLVSEKRTVEGHVRKYYTATEEGRQALVAVRRKMAELVGEVLREDAAETDASETGHHD